MGRPCHRRIPLKRGQSVLILGATGSAGQLAVQVADGSGPARWSRRGAARDRLAAMDGLGANDTVDLAAEPEVVARDLAAKAAKVDVVLDYLWGETRRGGDHGPVAGTGGPDPG